MIEEKNNRALVGQERDSMELLNSSCKNSIELLPAHVIHNILFEGGLGPIDLASLEATCYMFRAAAGFEPCRFKSIAELAARHSCHRQPLFLRMPRHARLQLLARCDGNWKLVLRFLQALEQASQGGVATSTSHKTVQMVAGKYHSLIVDRNGKLYACGSGLHGILGQGPDIKCCQLPTRIALPNLPGLQIKQISGSHNHAAFITQAGEVYTFGDNSSCCCGIGDVGQMITQPTLVDSLTGIYCQEVVTGLSYTVVMTREGKLYSWGSGSHGQLGHGNTQDEYRPLQIEAIDEGINPVVQVSAGVSHTLAVTKDGALYSFGYGANSGLGHGEFVSEPSPRRVRYFTDQEVFLVSAVAGDEHSAAIDSIGQVYTWGKGYCGALGHGDESDQSFPQLVVGLNSVRAVQVSARRRKTFVLTDSGTVFAFGWMAFGSLGVKDRGYSEKVVHPQSLDEAVSGQKIARMSAGQYHTLALSTKGSLLGFGDNEKWQLANAHTLQSGEEVFTEILH